MSILEDISSYIKSGESAEQNLGLEIEHFVVDDNGNQIAFDTISPLIKSVGESIGAEIHYMDGYPVGYDTGRYTTSLEPACQFEISIYPYSDLDLIRETYEEFSDLWTPVFAELGYHLVNKGNLPLVETGKITPDQIPLSPKKRYIYMNRYFEESGKYGKYMMRASASAQISVDYSSEKDMVRKLRVLQKISPILMILMENKTSQDTTLPQHPEKAHLLRTQEWDDLDSERTGFVPYSMDEDFGYRKMAEVIYKTPLILLTDNGETVEIGHMSAEDLISGNIIYENSLGEERKKRLIEHFMSMGFFHFRVKKYIEIRVADSVPIEKALGYTALIKGLIYSDDALTRLEGELVPVDSLEVIKEAVEQIERDGFDAVVYGGKTAKEWAENLIATAEDNLSEKDRGYLNNVRIVRNHVKE